MCFHIFCFLKTFLGKLVCLNSVNPVFHVLKICVYAYNTHPNTSNLSKNRGFRVDFQSKKNIFCENLYFFEMHYFSR